MLEIQPSLRWPNTFPKVLNLGRGRCKGKFPLGNWTNVVKGCWCGSINEDDPSQTPPRQQEPGKNLAIDRIVHTDRIQTYKGDPALTRPRNALANWTSVSLGNNTNRATVDEIRRNRFQWHIFDDNNTEYRPGQRCNDYGTSEETENAEGNPIYSDDGSAPSTEGLEDVS